MKAYLANALFSDADSFFNSVLATKLRANIPDLELYVPQENDEINDKSAFADSTMIAKGDSEPLLESDFLVAVLDGAVIDEGVACEIGMFSMLDKPIFALFTDVRQYGRDNPKKINALIEDATENQFPYRNLFVIGRIKDGKGGVYSNRSDLVNAIKEYSKGGK